MNLKLSIIDTENGSLISTESFAKDQSVILSYSGSDEIKQDVVASEISWEFLESTNTPAAYQDLFTANETKFKVQLINADSNAVLWQGFLLGDDYSEEYKHAPLFVKFTAICGLGLLKGKYFDESFYGGEQSVIDILSKCFLATGLNLDFVFSPGIENTTEKNFENIYVDMNHFRDLLKGTKDSMYDVLVEILESLLSVCYQENNKWFVVGINKRFLPKYNSKTYNFNGVLQSSGEITRRHLVANALAYPNITLDPPLKEVVVSRKFKNFGIDKELSKLENKGYVAEIALNQLLYPNAWVQSNGVNARASYKDMIVYLPNKFDSSGEVINSDYISLRNKPGVREGMKLQVNLKFKLQVKQTNEQVVQGYIDDGTFTNPIKYELLLNNEVIFSNYSGPVQTAGSQLKFDKELKAEAFYSFVADKFGVLDLKVYQPYHNLTNHPIEAFEFTSLEIKELTEKKDEDVYIHQINNGFTKVLEPEIPIADDIVGYSKAFLTARNKENEASHQSQTVTVLYSFNQNSKNYAVFSLFDVMMIDAYRNYLFNGVTQVSVLDVVYNYNGGEQMVIETSSLLASDTELTLKIFPYKINVDQRAYSETWSDAVYVIESKRFIEAYAIVLERVFKSSVNLLEGTFQKLIGFSDLLNFKYKGVQNFIPLNISQDLTRGTTDFYGVEALYNGEASVSIPPGVNAGEVVYISDSDTTVDLSATATDPDGEIVTILWEQISPVTPLAAFNDVAVLNPSLSNLTEDIYQFQVTVTDNDSLTASDTVYVRRDKVYTLSLVETSHTVETSTVDLESKIFRLQVSPDLVGGVTITMDFKSDVSTSTGGNTAYATAEIKVVKNGLDIDRNVVEDGDDNINKFTVNFISSDVIDIHLHTSGYYDDETPVSYAANSFFEIEDAVVSGTTSTVAGLPISESISVS